MLEECARFTEGVIEPLNSRATGSPHVEGREGQHHARIRGRLAPFAEGGWQGLQHPADFGGQALPKTIAAACMEMLNSANLSLALCAMLTDGAIEALLTAGSQQLKQT